MRCSHQNTFLFIALAAFLASCGGGGSLAGGGGKSSAKKETDSGTGGDKEDEGADEPAEIAGAFLDDGSGTSTQIGVTMKDPTSHAKLDSIDISKLKVKYVPTTGQTLDLPVTAAPANSDYHAVATMPSSGRGDGEIMMRYADGKARARSGRLKLSNFVKGLANGDGTYGNAADGQSTTGSSDDGVSGPAAETTAYDSKLAPPGGSALKKLYSWTPTGLSYLWAGVNFNRVMGPKLLCNGDGTQVQAIRPTLGFPEPAPVATLNPATDKVCFKRFKPFIFDEDPAKSTLAAGAAQLIPGDGIFVFKVAGNCHVIRGVSGGNTSYYSININSTDKLRTFVRAFHCPDDPTADSDE
jgi:hypothetical protein